MSGEKKADIEIFCPARQGQHIDREQELELAALDTDLVFCFLEIIKNVAPNAVAEYVF